MLKLQLNSRKVRAPIDDQVGCLGQGQCTSAKGVVGPTRREELALLTVKDVHLPQQSHIMMIYGGLQLFPTAV